MNNPLKSLIGLLFPNLCIVCSEYEPVYEKLFCHYCWTNLPRYTDLLDNTLLLQRKMPLIDVEKSKFHGLFLYSKGGRVQDILHDIKYYGKSHKAFALGQHLGSSIEVGFYDALIPVPIHVLKKRKRGYNQAEEFAKGINSVLGTQLLTKSLKKIVDTNSQTSLDRISRHVNVAKAYQQGIALNKDIKRVLLVDDVITTGATLEVCTKLLLQNKSVEVDYAFIAMAV